MHTTTTSLDFLFAKWVLSNKHISRKTNLRSSFVFFIKFEKTFFPWFISRHLKYKKWENEC